MSRQFKFRDTVTDRQTEGKWFGTEGTHILLPHPTTQRLQDTEGVKLEEIGLEDQVDRT